MEYKHVPVMLKECIDALDIHPGGIYVDGTLGGAGHSRKIGESLQDGRLIGIDRDQCALEAAAEVLDDFGDQITLVHDNFSRIKAVLENLDITGIDGALLDLGVSSYQLDEAERGFSYIQDAPLDMRMDRSASLNAYDVVNTYDETKLTQVLYEYGEERWAKRIVQFVIEHRPIRTTGELVEVIKAAIPKGARLEGGHPAKRTFQAIRIEVNGELEMLSQAVRDFIEVLNPGGRLAVITFHSLEDRIVKDTFASLAKGCTCPKDFPVCVCGGQPQIRVLTRKPILPTEQELEVNSRSKSAKLRVAEKL